MFNWSKSSRAASVVLDRLAEVQIFAADLDPVSMDTMLLMPLSAPFVRKIPPFSEPVVLAGLAGLLNLVKATDQEARESDYRPLL